MAEPWTHSYVCSTFKRELFEGVHNFKAHTFKLALYTSDAVLDSTTTAYQEQGEVPALLGYTAGGQEIDVNDPQLADTIALVDFEDVNWPNASFTARRALAYNASAVGWPALFVLDFGEDRLPNAGNFPVRFPGADPLPAIF